MVLSDPAMPLGFIPPMLPTLADRAPDGAEWLHEIKYDGYRTQVLVDGKAAHAITRNGHDWSDRYQPIVAAARALKCRSAILDGEVAVQAPGGVTDFAALRRSIKGSPERLVLFAFDLLHINGQDLRREPLIDRRRRLEDLIGAAHPTSRLHFSPHHVGDGPLIFKAADETGLEGIVSKRADSRYMTGRAKTWFKVKSFTVADYAVLGVERSSTGIPVALLATLGDRAYVGDAMITLTEKERGAFWAAVERLGTPKARLGGLTKRKATWLKAGLVARVRHLRGEEKLRHATLQTLDVRDPLPGEIDLTGSRSTSDRILSDPLHDHFLVRCRSQPHECGDGSMRGRMVMIYDRPDGELVQVFQVGVEDTHDVIMALLEEHPELDALHIVVDGVIDQTSVAFMELGQGEVRSAAVTALPASRSVPPSPSH